jgi:arylsulfatase
MSPILQKSFIATVSRLAGATALVLAPLAVPAADRPPNIVLIVTDDMGYGDLGCQGAKGFATPHLDRMASEGTRFTNFYVAQSVCTASRAALLTGCYPNRIGLHGALNHTSREGIHADEWLLPQMLRARGYATAGFGKWHLGTRDEFHPLRRGFDEWFGLPYSNDNSRYHPVLAAEMPPLPLYDGTEIVERDPDQSQFTRRFTERAVGFIRRHADRPFFLYAAHVMPHVPLFASERFRGKSAAGVYGDVMEELDWSVGEILGTLRTLKLERNTLVVFLSDNGPFLSYRAHAGSAGPLREGKLTVFEGGVRVPCLAWGPGRVLAGRVCTEPFMAIDWLPTFTELVGGRAPANPIDGRSVRSLLLGEPGARPPHEALFFYAGTELHAVRSGPWKLHLPHSFLTVRDEPAPAGKPAGWGRLAPKSIGESGVDGIASRHGYRVEQLPRSLFDLPRDPGEKNNVADAHLDVVARLERLADAMRQDLGDSLRKIAGTGRRPAGLAP